MTQQRTLLVPFSFVLAAVACGGGAGQVVEVDSDGPPDLADQQPQGSNQNPVSAGSLPPNSPPPPGGAGSPVTPPPGGAGGSCVALCNELPAFDCARPEEGCDAACGELLAEECGAQGFALQVCALPLVCPGELADSTAQQRQQVAALCPAEYQAFLACDASSGNND